MFDLLSPVHLVILLVIALLVFGPRRLPEIGAGLGKGLREFRQAMQEVTAPLKESAPKPPLPPDNHDTTSP